MINDKKILEAQLRECYGRVIYTHKTHEKCADILIKNHNRIKNCHIFISSIITGGLIVSLFDIDYLSVYQKYGVIIIAILSTISIILETYTKKYDMGKIAQEHRQAAADLWLIREEYLSLLVDLKMSIGSIEDIKYKRDILLKKQHNLYKGIPSTNYKAYSEARNALKNCEEMTFSDKEIDIFLPRELRKEQL